MRSEVQVLLDPPFLSGALAQLVERLLCKQDVIGSNPLGSTIIPDMISKRVLRFLVLSDALLLGAFNIVQRDNQRCRPHPSGGVVAIFGSPTTALSKSSTLTKVPSSRRGGN